MTSHILLPREIWKEILLFRCWQNMRDRLTTHNMDPDKVFAMMRQYGMVISGFSIISCLTECDYGDIDFFYHGGSSSLFQLAWDDISILNLKATTGILFRTQFTDPHAQYEERLLNYDNSKPVYSRCVTTFVSCVAETKEKKKVDFVDVPYEPKKFLTDTSDVDILTNWFDGRKFSYSFDMVSFALGPASCRSGNLLSLGSALYEEFYTARACDKEEIVFQANKYRNFLHEGVNGMNVPTWKSVSFHDLEHLAIAMFPTHDFRCSFCFGSEIDKMVKSAIKSLVRVAKYRSRGVKIYTHGIFDNVKKSKILMCCQDAEDDEIDEIDEKEDSLSTDPLLKKYGYRDIILQPIK